MGRICQLQGQQCHASIIGINGKAARQGNSIFTVGCVLIGCPMHMGTAAAELLAVYVHAAALLCVCLHTLHRFEFWNLKWKFKVLHAVARGACKPGGMQALSVRLVSVLWCCQLWLQYSTCFAGGC